MMQQHPQAALQERFEEDDLSLSPGILKYGERRIDLSTARTNQEQTWLGNYLYVQELAGTLQIRINNPEAPLITLREGDIIRTEFQRVYLTNTGVAAWGTAVVLIGRGDFDLEPGAADRHPIAIYSATGAAAIALSTTEARRFKLVRVTVHFSAAPTTAEDFTLTLNSNAGAAYDTVLFSNDPSVGAVTDLVFTPDSDQVYESGDELDAAFPNTDAVTYGIQIVVEPA